MDFASAKAAAVSLRDGTAAAFHRTSFLNNTIQAQPSDKTSHILGSAMVAGEQCFLLMHDCTFRNNLVEASGGSNRPGIPLAESFGLPDDVSDDVASVSVAQGAFVYTNPERKVFDNAAGKSRAAMHWSPTDDFSISDDDFKKFKSVRFSCV